jgi:hypothetical protein
LKGHILFHSSFRHSYQHCLLLVQPENDPALPQQVEGTAYLEKVAVQFYHFLNGK